MAFTPFVETDLPTMANFNAKFQEAIQAAIDKAPKVSTGSYVGTGTSYFSIPINTWAKNVIIQGPMLNANDGGILVLIKGSDTARPYPTSGSTVSVSFRSTVVALDGVASINRQGSTYTYIQIG